MDLRPGYRELAPLTGPAGRAGVLWCHVIVPGAPPSRILPDGCADLIWIADRGLHLAGPDTVAQVAELPAGAVVLGARLAPGAGGPALGRRLDGLRDAREPLPGVIEGDLAPAAALAALSRHVRALVAAAPPDRAVAEAARRLRADPRRRIPALAAELGYSERQLRRRCLAVTGHAPKTLQRVLRLQRTVAAMDRGEHDLARLAADHGYADQAHLTGEFSELAGLPPAVLLRSRSAAGARAGG
jgi:AraC-like DNA-binding protein